MHSHSRGRSPTIGADSPKNDLCLVDLVTGVVGCVQAWGFAHRTIDIDCLSANPTNDMVMVVADTVLIQRRGAGWLNPSDQPLLGENSQRVVNGLFGNGANLGKHRFHNLIRPAVRIFGDRTQDGQPLGGDLNAVLSKESGCIQHIGNVY